MSFFALALFVLVPATSKVYIFDFFIAEKQKLAR